MKIISALILSLAIIPPAAGHDLPVHPVHVRIKVDPGLVRVRIVTDGAMLGNDLLGFELPESGWPEHRLKQARDWINESFPLKIDGKPVKCRLTKASYQIDGWKKISKVGTVGWEGMFLFEAAYDLPADAETLSGQTFFYLHDWEDAEDMRARGQKSLFDKDFRTFLDIPGKKHTELEIEIEEKFSVQIADAMRSDFQRLFEAASLSWRLPWPVFYALFALLILIGRHPPAQFIVALVPGVFIFGVGAIGPGRLASASHWLALTLWAAFILRQPSPSPVRTRAAAIAAGTLIGLGWCSFHGPLSALPISATIARVGILIGTASAILAVAAAVTGIYRLCIMYLRRKSMQMADRLLVQNGRFAAIGIAALGLFYAVRALLPMR